MPLPKLKLQEILLVLKRVAEQMDGLDYLQVFEGETKDANLWFIEDNDGEAITGMLPSDY